MGVPYAEVIGDPIKHSKSPIIHNFWLNALGIPGEYRAARVTAEELPAYLDARRVDPDWRGCNVTMPLKTAIIPLLDHVADGRSINCVTPKSSRLLGWNTDRDGLLEASSAWQLPFFGETICLVGAGGAARTAIDTLGDDMWQFDFHVIARDPLKAQESLALEGACRAFPFSDAHTALLDCAAVVNASPLGMLGYPPMPESVLEGLELLKQPGYALEMVTAPSETCFLRRSREIGLTVSDGLTMLIGQARRAFELFFNVRLTTGGDPSLRELLTS
ncbi:MAG TPA: shikimate dehydrogenase [Allosphingosinicella sp.]|jgi:shikimate dehydrogenase